jgi:DNA-directed RNA polymerase specialized sigma24 family protein
MLGRYVFEETSEEIAARLQISSASVRMRLARLLAMLRVAEAEP